MRQVLMMQAVCVSQDVLGARRVSSHGDLTLLVHLHLDCVPAQATLETSMHWAVSTCVHIILYCTHVVYKLFCIIHVQCRCIQMCLQLFGYISICVTNMRCNYL